MPRHRRIGAWVVVVMVVLLLAAAVFVMGLTGRTLSAPDWVVERVEIRANAALAGQARVRVAGIEALVDNSFVPHVRLRGVELFSSHGGRVAEVPDLRVTLDAGALLRGRIEPHRLRIRQARISLTRLADGSLDFELPGAGLAGAPKSLAEMLDSIDSAFNLPELSRIELVSADDVTIRLEDLRARKVWTVTGGHLTVEQDEARIAMALAVSLGGIGETPATAELDFTSQKASRAADLSARVSGVSSADLAAQSPALAWLAPLDAPISGSFHTDVDADGKVGALDATLEIGAGALQPTPDTRPVRFDHARVTMSFDPESARLTLSEVAVDSPALRARADGTAWLKRSADGVSDTLIGQVRITQLAADPEGLFADPVSFSQGAFDLKLDLSPFRLTLGQLVLIDAGRRISAKGTVAAEPKGWAVSLDIAIDAIESGRMLALWPVSVVPKTRRWLSENVATGELFDVKAALRLAPGVEPRLSLGYQYRAAEVRFMRSLPPVEDGAGYATIDDYVYTLVVESGHITAPLGGDLDVAGSVMSVPDIRIKPAPARITLKTDSSITAALSLLDQPPFQFLSRAGRPVDLAEGRARAEAVIDLVLTRKLRPEQVRYLVNARLSDATSDRIVPGRRLTAPALDLIATRKGIEISGAGTLSDVPFDMTWRQIFGPDHRGKSSVEGSVELSPLFLSAFSIGLPQGAVAGKGSGDFTLSLVRGQPTAFRLTSGLGGLTLSLPQVGWTKAAATTGDFEITGQLGKPPRVDSLSFDAAGLTTTGRLELHPDGGLATAGFDVTDLAGWFRGALTLEGRGKGQPPAVSITGGSADLRLAPFGKTPAPVSDQPPAATGAPVSVALETLQISEKIALTGFRGDFSSLGGLNGQFSGSINGAAPVTGTIVPFGGRSGFRVHAEDAGAALAAAGVYARAREGRLDMTLVPAAPGTFDGKLSIASIRVVDAPALAALLDTISVVGLITQLNGTGILFSSVTGEFRLTPSAVEITRGSAVGPSLGISAAGVIDNASHRLDLQGTVSPIYLLNSIGQIVSKRGEGLFGFNYRIAGDAAAPVVSVNPLSLLTPGIFREIFRSPAPRLAP